MNHFCTISTTSHLYKTYALADSLRKVGHNFVLHVLVTDGPETLTHENCIFYGLKKLKGDTTGKQIEKKYSSHPDKLRWSMKPVFMLHLLRTVTDKVVYTDNDQYFYSDYMFLFQLLEQHSILLTPHYYKHSPNNEQNWLEANFKVGLYNAGFIGASIQGQDTLQWWAECCLYRCEKNMMRGLFDDQKYLDLIPVIDSKSLVLRHQGCNVAGWNTEYCKRSVLNGRVMINNSYPVVFIHFNAFTIREIEEERDKLLVPLYHEYVDCLRRYKPTLKPTDLLSKISFTEKLKYYIWAKATALGL